MREGGCSRHYASCFHLHGGEGGEGGLPPRKQTCIRKMKDGHQCGALHCGPARCSAAQRSTVQCSTVKHSAVQWSAVPCAAQYGAVHYNVAQRDAVQYSTVAVQSSMTQHGTVQAQTVILRVIFCIRIRTGGGHWRDRFPHIRLFGVLEDGFSSHFDVFW